MYEWYRKYFEPWDENLDQPGFGLTFVLFVFVLPCIPMILIYFFGR